MSFDAAHSVGDVLSLFGHQTTDRIRQWIYRGHSGVGWPLLSTLERREDRVDFETMGLRNFARYGASYLRFPAGWGLVTEAQHYGFPTRMLMGPPGGPVVPVWDVIRDWQL